MRIDLTDINYVKGLHSNLRATFETPTGRESMRFMQKLSGWFPTAFDSMETNDIIARDANRRLLGTIKTFLELTPEQIVALAKRED